MTLKAKGLTIILVVTLGMATSGQVKSVAGANAARAENLQMHLPSDLNQHTKAARFRRSGDLDHKTSPKVSTASSKDGAGDQKPPTSSNQSSPATNVVAAVNPGVLSQIYRVGVNDVLDIQLAEGPATSSTLFTVLEGGLLEYPFAGEPVVVAGLTTSEIAAHLRQRIKLFDHPTVVVNVRDYASHFVTVSGFVAVPGTRTLRREAVPLYTILAEAQVLPDATSATIISQGRAPFVVDLRHSNVLSTLVGAGDLIKVSGLSTGATEFFFIGGEVKSPGQKTYHPGLTLTQAILASGGTNSTSSKVRVSRQGVDGKLTSAEYDLRDIQAGKIPDPTLQKGDRIEVINAN